VLKNALGAGVVDIGTSANQALGHRDFAPGAKAIGHVALLRRNLLGLIVFGWGHAGHSEEGIVDLSMCWKGEKRETGGKGEKWGRREMGKARGAGRARKGKGETGGKGEKWGRRER
jgi:hypothetical protein